MTHVGDGTPSAAATHRGPWYRFSLRSMLLLVTAMALLCSWVGLPLIHARQFQARIDAQDFERAAQGFVDAADHRMLSEWSPIVRAAVGTDSLTLGEVGSGRRKMQLTVTYRLQDGREFPMRFQMVAGQRGMYCLSGLPPQR